MFSTANCFAETQLHGHFVEAPSGCGAIEVFAIAKPPTRRRRPRIKIRSLTEPAQVVSALPGLATLLIIYAALIGVGVMLAFFVGASARF